MRQLAMDVLALSKEFNDSNEVAITCDIDAGMPLSVSIVILHNYPLSQTFSLEDIE